MEITEINYITEQKIELVGELDIDMDAECIHLGCYSEDDNWRDNAHIGLKLYPHIRLSDLEQLFKWVSHNTGYRSIPIGDDPSIKVPYESNWKVTLERLD